MEPKLKKKKQRMAGEKLELMKRLNQFKVKNKRDHLEL